MPVRRPDKKNLNIDLVFDNDVCYVRADADKIKMVITNLIDNAIKSLMTVEQ